MRKVLVGWSVASGDDNAAPLLRAGILSDELRSSDLLGWGDGADMIDIAEPDEVKARARSKEEAQVARCHTEQAAQ